MADAGVDTAMMDVIGAQETIRDVYHLERPVEDFEATLAALCATTMEVVPHIVIGLHYGRILGEAGGARHRQPPPRAFARAGGDHAVLRQARHLRDAATPRTSAASSSRRASESRTAQVLLGCARPPGMHRRVTDAYAVMAGLDGIAFPADGALGGGAGDRPAGGAGSTPAAR